MRSRRSPSPAVISLLLLLAVAVAACSGNGDDASYDLADEIIASIDQPVTRAVASDDCTRTVVIDEYGFETETTVCAPAESGVDDDDQIAASGDDPPAGQGEPSIDVDALLADDATLPLDLFATLAGDVPDDGLRRSLGALFLLLDELDSSCGVDLQVWIERAETAAGEVDVIAVDLETAVAGGGAVADHVGSSSARLLARSLLERTLLLSGCSVTGDGLSPADGAMPRLNAATATLAAAVEHLGRGLRGSDADPLFFHPDELAHLRWMRTVSEPVEFVVAGTSQATHGISPVGLGESSGRVVGSVAIPGSVAELQQHWLPIVMEEIDPRTVIWAVGPIDLVVGCDGDSREAVFVEGAARRAASFRTFGWLDGIEPFGRILGPVGNEVYLETPIGRLAADRYPSNELGEAVRLGSISEVAIEEHRANFGPAFERGEYCEDRAALIRSIIEDLRADGRDVVLVGMPISPELVPFYPGGREALTEVMERFGRDVAEPTGTPFVDLTGAIQEARYWSDWVHPVAEGSSLFTAAIAQALTDLGVW